MRFNERGVGSGASLPFICFFNLQRLFDDIGGGESFPRKSQFCTAVVTCHRFQGLSP